jgi:DNA invertase Pin-like site-specific DNA recombinase
MERTQAGIAKARKRGKTFGRPARLNAKQRAMIAERYAAGATMAEPEVGEATIWRLRGIGIW